MRKVAKTAGAAFIAGSMLLFPLSNAAWSAATAPANASATAQTETLQPFAGTKLKTFLISDKSYVQVKDIFFQYDNNSKKVFFTLLVYNGDKQAIDFTYYYPEVFATSGGKFTVQEHPGNKKSGIVEPGTTEEFIYYANINPNMNYTDLVFKVQKIDFSAPNYTRLIGQAAVTSSYQNSVPSKHYYIIRKGTDKLKTYLQPGSKLVVSGDNQVRLRFEMENVGWMTYTIPNLQFYILTKAGHMVKLTSDLANQTHIQPSEKIVVTLSGAIKSNIDLNGTKLIVQAASGGDQGIETPIAIYNLVWDAASSFVTGENQRAQLKVAGMDMEAGIETLYLDKTETQNEWTVTLKWTNKGDSAVTLPKFKYELMDSRGVRYPVEVQEADNIQVVPGIDKEIIGTAVTPPTVNGPFTLLVRYPKDEANPAEYVAAAFRLNAEQATGPVEGKRYRNEYGLYQISVSKVERLPWGDEDLINAYVEIENLGSASQVIPQIKAALKLNGISVSEQDVTIMKLEDKIMLGAKEKTSFVVSTKVPYTYELDELTLNLSEQTSGEAKSTIGLFRADKISPPTSVLISSKHAINSVGRRASLEFLNTYVFEGKDDDLLYAEFSYTNDESRSKTLPALKGYFKASDGSYIEAEIVNVKSQVKTKGKAHLAAKAVIPKTFVSDGSVELIIGEAIENGQYGKPDGTPDGFIRAVSFKLPKNQNVVKEEFVDLAFKPYKLTIHNAFAVLSDMSNVRLDLRYTLDKTAEFNVMETGRKLYVEIAGNNLKYGKTIEVEPKQNDGNGLRVGTEQEVRIEIQGQNVGSLIYNGYTVNIYEEIDGYKRLLGSKDHNSFQLPV
jgi:hypothetical protein